MDVRSSNSRQLRSSSIENITVRGNEGNELSRQSAPPDSYSADTKSVIRSDSRLHRSDRVIVGGERGDKNCCARHSRGIPPQHTRVGWGVPIGPSTCSSPCWTLYRVPPSNWPIESAADIDLIVRTGILPALSSSSFFRHFVPQYGGNESGSQVQKKKTKTSFHLCALWPGRRSLFLRGRAACLGLRD